jgi:hypothetical protein
MLVSVDVRVCARLNSGLDGSSAHTVTLASFPHTPLGYTQVCTYTPLGHPHTSHHLAHGCLTAARPSRWQTNWLQHAAKKRKRAKASHEPHTLCANPNQQHIVYYTIHYKAQPQARQLHKGCKQTCWAVLQRATQDQTHHTMAPGRRCITES